MSNRVKYIILHILDLVFSFGVALSALALSYLVPTNSTGYKITLTGIVLLIAVIMVGKSVFEKRYRAKYDSLLQQLAEATDIDLKKAISKELNIHKMKQDIYQRFTIILPFIIVYMITYLGEIKLATLQATVGYITLGLTIGSIFNVTKRKYYELANLDRIKRKIK